MKKSTKYILASSLTAILTITLFGVYALNQYTAFEIREDVERQEMSIRAFWRLLADKGTDFRIADGKLLAGDYPLNGNFELPDKVQDIFGGVATIFMGDERVSTNVLNAEGKRAIGTRLEGPAYEAVFKQGKSYRGEAVILGVPYLTAYDPIRDRTGKIVGALFVGGKKSELLASLTDLEMHLTLILSGIVIVFTMFMMLLGRAMKRVEEANENQIRFQQTLLNTMPSPVFYKDAECRYLGCNKAFEAFVGFSQAELVGKTPHEIWPEELADIYRQQDMALLGNPDLQVYETAVRFADGTLREVIFYKAAFEGNNGAVAGLVGVIHDITERKAAEEETKSAYQQLFDIVDFLPDATFVVDKDKSVIAWNRAIENMTGLKKEEVIGKGDHFYSIPFYGVRRPMLIDFLDNDLDDFKNLYGSIERDGRTLSVEVCIPSFRDGEDRYFWSTASSLFDKDGKKIGAIQTIRDVTERRRSEEEKSRLAAQLHLSQILGPVMIQLGHDLKTPLTPLLALLPLLRDRASDPESKRMAGICSKNASHIRELSDKVLRLAKLSSVTDTAQRENMALASSVDEYIRDSRPMAAEKDLSWENLIDPTVFVQAAPEQLRELFANLISNAIRFSAPNGSIRIFAERGEKHVTVAVQDKGVGIAPEHLESIFNEFFKTDESRHDLASSGLGLSICKRIVLNHQGRIWAESPGKDQGTTILFTLPLFEV